MRCTCQKLFHWACLQTSSCAMRCRDEAIRAHGKLGEQRLARTGLIWVAFLVALVVAIVGQVAGFSHLGRLALLTFTLAAGVTSHQLWLELRSHAQPPYTLTIAHHTFALLMILSGWLILEQAGFCIGFLFFGVGTFLEFVRMLLPLAALAAAPGIASERTRPYTGMVLFSLLLLFPLSPDSGLARRYVKARDCELLLSSINDSVSDTDTAPEPAHRREHMEKFLSDHAMASHNRDVDPLNHMLEFYTFIPGKGTESPQWICRDHAEYFATQKRMREAEEKKYREAQEKQR